jgi:repressor LexA
MKAIERLFKYLEYKDIPHTRFEKKVGLSNGYLNTQFKRKADLGESVFQKIIDNNLDLNPIWLLRGEGSMLKDSEPKLTTVNEIQEEYGNKPSKSSIPLVTKEAIAGIGNANFSISKEDIQEFYVVPDFKEIDFMIRVTGSSMYPKYNSGDIVACRILQEPKYLQWNKVHLIGTKDQGILIKRLRKGQSNDHLLCVSDNKDYEPFEIPRSEVTGVALVVGVIRLE